MEALEMLKTPSTLKWLAEKRARVLGELEPQELLLRQVESEVLKLRADLSALDRALALYDSSVDAASIESISAWAGNYGARGSLIEFLMSVIEASFPRPVSTCELEVKAAERFSLVFETKELAQRWKRNSLRRALQKLANAGKLEAMHEGGTRHVGSWRWVQPKALTLAELRAGWASVNEKTGTAVDTTAAEQADAVE